MLFVSPSRVRVSSLLLGAVLIFPGRVDHAAACPSDADASARGSGSVAPIAVTPRGNPEEIGQWLAPMDWPTIAIHAAVLSNGEVLHYSYPESGTRSRAVTYNPATGEFADVNGLTNVFCSGLTHLEDGDLLIVGGNSSSGCGRVLLQRFEPVSKVWSVMDFLNEGRWYPNVVRLGDGRIQITSGINQNCAITSVMEIYTPGTPPVIVEEGERSLELFPRTHLLSDGRVAYVGPDQITGTFDPNIYDWAPVDFSDEGTRYEGTSVLVPGTVDEVMIIGGYVDGFAASVVERINFADPETGWQPTGSLTFGRANANAVILPDKTVALVGGGTVGSYDGSTKNIELYNPETGTWTLGPAQVYGRMYHSTSVLMPDGRILSAGQDSGESAYKGEIYEPGYLFRGDRPVIDSAPESISYGASFTIETANAGEITSAALIALSSVTHSVNTNQRYVGLSFNLGAENELIASAPAGGNLAPPGMYMLFILNGDGVPSEARMVRVSADVPVCEGDANNDGTVDPLDAGFVMAEFGCAVGTGDTDCDIADQNADSLVDPLDVGFVLTRFGDCS